MLDSSIEILTTPRRDDLKLLRIENGSGLSISFLPTGAIYAIEHTEANRRIMINQTLALPIGNGMARLYLRTGGARPINLPSWAQRRRFASAPRTTAMSGRERRTALATGSPSGCTRD